MSFSIPTLYTFAREARTQGFKEEWSLWPSKACRSGDPCFNMQL